MWSECSLLRLSERKADPWLHCKTSQQCLRREWVCVCVSSSFSVWESYIYINILELFALLKLSLKNSLYSCCWGISGRRQRESLGQQDFICSMNYHACANARMLPRLCLTLREFCFSIVSKTPYYGDKER